MSTNHHSQKYLVSIFICLLIVLNLISSGSFLTQAAKSNNEETPNPSLPFVYINDLVIPENKLEAVFTVKLSQPSGSDIHVNFSTANGTAIAGQDYVSTSDSLAFPAFSTEFPIIVPLLDDSTIDGHKYFTVNLTSANNATISDPQGYCALLDDDTSDQKWVKTYDTPGQLDFGGKFIVTDGSNNVYVAGFTTKPGIGVEGDKFTLLKYDTNGVQKWVVTKSGDVLDMDIDQSGNIYVAGLRNKPYEAFLQKFNSSGTLIWEKAYKGPLSKETAILDMVIDASGNIYVTGETTANKSGGKFYMDFFTQKYTSSGTLLWTKLYGGTVKRDDGGYAIDVDLEGNAYVSGYVQIDLAGTCSIYVLKYNSSGTLLWEKSAHYSGHSSYMVYDLVLDSLGNLYIASTAGSVPWILKYKTDGTFLWARADVGGVGGNGVPYKLVVDQSGYLYIAAGTAGGFTLAKVIPSNGNPVWVLTDIDGSCYDVVLDETGHAFAAGTLNMHDQGGYNAATFMFDINGGYLWHASYNASVLGFSDDEAYGIAIDTIGNTYVTGETSVTLPDDTEFAQIFTIKYGPYTSYPPTLSISDSIAFETGIITNTSEIRFTVKLSKPASEAVTISFNTKDGTALQGVDYIQSSGTTSIPAGETTGEFIIQILEDGILDGGKFFFINLSNPMHAFFTDSQAMGTIYELGPYVQFLPLLTK